MSRVCELTGIRPSYGNKVSHSNIKTRTRWNPNLRAKKYEIAELKQTISLLLSTRAIRTIDKVGSISAAIMKAKDGELSERLLKIKRGIYRSRVKASSTPAAAKPKHVPGQKEAAAAALEAKPAKAAKGAKAAKASKAKSPKKSAAKK